MLLFSHKVISDSLCPMDCSMPGFPVFYHLPEFAQTEVHWVSDAIQPSHPLSPSSPPALNLSQHQGLFQWIGSSYQVAKVLELQLQHQSFQWISEYSGLTSFRIDSFDLLAVQGTLKSHLQQFKSINSLELSLFYGPSLTSICDCWKKRSFDYTDLCWQSSIWRHKPENHMHLGLQ